MTKDSSFLNILHPEFEKMMHEVTKENDQDPTNNSSLLDSATLDAVDAAASSLLDNLKIRAPQMLQEHRKLQTIFEDRNFARWMAAFDLFEMMIVMAGELGEECDSEGREKAQQDKNYKFEALSHLMPRALLVAREILCLLKCGLPDGALSRWRSLHEIAVTAIFLANQDTRTSFRYLASFHFHAYNAAIQYNHYAERAKLRPFTDLELAEMKNTCNHLSIELGGSPKGDYGWAAEALGITNKKVTFFDIEEFVKMDHWRLRYKWASQHTHSTHRPAGSLLGMSEAKETGMLIGSSNSGFVDPFSMSAISLLQVTVTILGLSPNFDRLVHIKILSLLADEISETAEALETSSKLHISLR